MNEKRETRTTRLTIRLRPIIRGFLDGLAETESHRLGRRVSSADIIEMLVMREMRRRIGASGDHDEFQPTKGDDREKCIDDRLFKAPS